ncbi:hypothetical protein GCM10022251_64530 [Phytohabitans flavus]
MTPEQSRLLARGDIETIFRRLGDRGDLRPTTRLVVIAYQTGLVWSGGRSAR